MNHSDVMNTLNRLVDGQQVKVTVASGQTYEGVYNAEASSLEAGFYFETMEGRDLRADWEKVVDISFRSAKMTVGQRFVIPPEHPLSGQQQDRRAYTKRNPIPGAED